MGPGRNQYCSIFVRAVDPEPIAETLSTLFGAAVDDRELILDGYTISVLNNSDAADEHGEDFVRWPVLIEIEADDPNDDRRIVEPTTRIVTTLWNSGQPAVAACDFEDELPWSGGIQRVREWSNPTGEP